MRSINKIIVHCSATKPSQDIDAETIRRWHVDGNKWSDIGYHYVIKRDGTVEKGRLDEISGAHVRGHNKDSIGVCLIGGIDERSRSDSNYTRRQWVALEQLITTLTKRYPDATVRGHRDYDAGKDCPCFDVAQWLDVS